MNVALFASAFHPSLGGVEELVRQLAHQQRVRGDNPLVVTNRWPKSLPAAEEFEGLPVRRFVFRVPERTVKQMAGAMLFGPGTCRSVYRALRAHRTEILHVQCVSSNAYYALMAKRKLGLPLVVSLQGEFSMDATGLFQRSAFARTLYRAALREADQITACSAQTLAEAEAFYGRPFGARGQVVYNGVNVADFDRATPFKHERPYILGIGRMVAQKGFDLLINAFARSGITSQDLLLAGDGVERGALEALARDLGKERQIHFLGRADRAAVASLFKGCSVFVLPSRHEPMGIVNLEAMAAGRPVLAARVGGVPEFVIENETGLLFPSEDIGMLRQGLCRLVGDPELSARLGEAGYRHALRFDWTVIADQYADVYRRTVADAAASRRK